MQRRPTLLIFLFLAAACRQPSPQPAATNHDSTLYYPYAPVYSNDYKPGEGRNAQRVLQIWKEFESGDVLHTSTLFADSLTFIFPDEIIKGSRTTVLTALRRRRAAYTDMQCYVDSWMPLHENTRNENSVLLWGRQDGTTAKGRRDYRVLHEIWRFDAAGRIRQLDQYETHAH